MEFTKKVEKELFFEIILFCSAVLAIILLFQADFALTSLLIGVSIIGARFWYKKHDAHFYVIGAVLGSVTAIVCVSFGVWGYANPTFLGIPLWLPVAWGLSVMLIKRIAETFVKIEMK
jgi:hypothetical protein